jgi:hypothetical protein
MIRVLHALDTPKIDYDTASITDAASQIKRYRVDQLMPKYSAQLAQALIMVVDHDAPQIMSISRTNPTSSNRAEIMVCPLASSTTLCAERCTVEVA